MSDVEDKSRPCLRQAGLTAVRQKRATGFGIVPPLLHQGK